MGVIALPLPVMPILAAFSRHETALAWARERAVEFWGPVALESPVFDFRETEYYAPAMGHGLKKIFWAYERLADPAELASWKRQTNQWEADYNSQGIHPESRPLNLDPGYMTLGKLVLASTKDHAHRIYLHQGIYAEVTLVYQQRAWRTREWTFPDFQRADYHEFFNAARRLLAEHAKKDKSP